MPTSKNKARYASPAEHDAALDATYGQPHGALLAADLTPSRLFTIDELAARLAMPLRRSAYADWSTIDTARADGRTPWREPDRMPALTRVVRGLGDLLIRRAGFLKGHRAELILRVPPDAKPPLVTTAHGLVHANSGREVRFDDRHAAVAALEPVVMADGALPAAWAWNPPLDSPGGAWAPPPRLRYPDVPEIRWRGDTGRWTVVRVHGRFYADRNGKPVVDGQGAPLAFATAADAKTHCEQADTR